MPISNDLNISQEGVVYFNGTNTFSGIDGSTVGRVMTSNGTDVAPSFQPVSTSGAVTSVLGTANQVAVSGTTIATISLIGPYTPATYTAHGILIGEGTSSIVALGAGNSGQVLRSGGAGADPAYSTATYPATATGTGTILRADGTNWAATTATYPNTVSQGDIIYGSASNVISSLAKDANATRYLSNQGASNSPSWNQVTLTNGVTGVLPLANGGTNASSMATSTGIVKYDGTRLVTSSTAIIDASNRYINTSQPCVSAYLNTTLTDVTGDGTNKVVICDSTFVNQGSAYSTSTGVFTAPVTGNYIYSCQVGFAGILVGHTQGALLVRLNGSNRQYQQWNPFIVLNATDNMSMGNISGIIAMSATETLEFLSIISGSTKTVDISGLTGFGVATAISISLIN